MSVVALRRRTVSAPEPVYATPLTPAAHEAFSAITAAYLALKPAFTGQYITSVALRGIEPTKQDKGRPAAKALLLAMAAEATKLARSLP